MFDVHITIIGIKENEYYQQKITITYTQSLTTYIIAWLYHNVWEQITTDNIAHHQEKCILLHTRNLRDYQEVYGEMEFFHEDRR